MVPATIIALRRIRRRPLLPTAVIVLSAAAIALNSALFSVVDALYWRSSPYAHQEELFVIGPRSLRQSATPDAVSQTMADEIATLPGVRQIETASVTSLDGGSGAEDAADLRGARISFGFFQMLGVRPIAGRLFSGSDTGDLSDIPVLIARSLWRSRFANDPDIVGRRFDAASARYRVIGVLPERVRVPVGSNIWLPSRSQQLNSDGYFRSLTAVARLDAGNTRAQPFAPTYQLQPFATYLDPSGALAMVLLSAVGLLVLLAMWSQLASLQATKLHEREQEVATRVALGATMQSIRLLFLAESLVLTVASAALACALMPAALLFLASTLPATLVDRVDIALDGRAFMVIGVLSLTGAIAHAVAVVRIGPGRSGALMARSHGVGALGLMGPGAWLLGAQFAAATALVYLCGLAVHSGASAFSVDLGFNAARTIAVGLPWDANPTVMHERFSRTSTALSAVEGVESVAGASTRPLGGVRFLAPLSVAGAGPEKRLAEVVSVTPNYFRAMGIRLLAGRDVSANDTRDHASVAVINETAANMFGGISSVLGKTLPLNGGLPVNVIAVAADTRSISPDQPPGPQLYVPVTQGLPPSFLLVKVRSSAASMAETKLAVTAVLKRGDPRAGARTAMLLSSAQDKLLAPYRGRLALLLVISMSALAVTAIGLFGAVEDLVRRQTRTIAIRLVLGAAASDIVRAIAGRVGLIALVGSAVGVFSGWTAGVAARSMLFGVSPADPATVAASCVVLCVVVLGALAFPLSRALRIEPAAALRDW